MIKNIVGRLIELILVIFGKKTFKDIKFYATLNKSPQELDRDTLISLLCYEVHHLDKMIKKEYNDTISLKRKERIIELLEVVKNKYPREKTIIEWTEKILDLFDIYLKKKEKILSLISGNISDVKSMDIVLKSIKSRASIRFWKAEEIDERTIRKIVSYGLQGPISCNRQAFKICVEKNKKDYIELGSSINASMLKKAPVKMYIAVNLNIYREKSAPALDCGSFCANALLAAQSFGLGGCWVYACETINQDQIRTEFGISNSFYVYSILLVGHPIENPVKPARRDAESIIIYKKSEDI